MKTFLKFEKPILTCMVQADNPDRIKELIDLSLPLGAEAFGMQFCKMKAEYRNKEKQLNKKSNDDSSAIKESPFFFKGYGYNIMDIFDLFFRN